MPHRLSVIDNLRVYGHLYGMPDVEVSKQASWGATRDNLVLGSEGNGIEVYRDRPRQEWETQ